MAKERDHLRQAWHNTILGKMLCEKRPMYHRDWVVTISFYAALHFVEAWLSTTPMQGAYEYKKNNSINDSIHEVRINLVKNGTNRQTFSSFRHLYIMSKQARYLMNIANTAFDFFDDATAKKAIYAFLKNIIVNLGYESSQDNFNISDVLN